MSKEAGPASVTDAPDSGVTRPAPRSLKHLAIRGSVWTFAGYGVGQVLRLGSNLILTRLLFPEAFGVMALVNVFLQGLAMFSDLGLAPSIVQNPRGEDPDFLRTAWTIQMARGLVLWLGAIALCLPAARFYDEPALARFLPVAGLSLLIASLSSTNFHLLQRRLDVFTQTLFNIGGQIVGLTVSVIGALIWRAVIEQRNLEWTVRALFEGRLATNEALPQSYLWGAIWALILGTLAGRALQTVVTFFLPGPKMRLVFRKEHARELIRFGKWIFVGTLLAFVVNFLDRPVLAKFMDSAQLGVYIIGLNLPSAMLEVLRAIAGRVLFPVYAELVRERPQHLRSRMLRARLILACVTLPVLWIMVIAGPQIVDFLYDDRWAEAGIFMQILGIGTIFTTLMTPVESIFLSVGDSFRHFVMLVSRSLLYVASIAVGGYFYGAYGIILGIAVAPALNYPFLAVLVRKYGAWTPLFDAACVAVSALVILLGLWVKVSIL